MKLKVIKTFSDKYTGETVEAGTEAEYSADRAKELINAKVAIKADKAAKKAK